MPSILGILMSVNITSTGCSFKTSNAFSPLLHSIISSISTPERSIIERIPCLISFSSSTNKSVFILIPNLSKIFLKFCLRITMFHHSEYILKLLYKHLPEKKSANHILFRNTSLFSAEHYTKLFHVLCHPKSVLLN